MNAERMLNALRFLALVTVAIFVLAPAVAQAGFLESDYGQHQPSPPPPQPQPQPQPRPIPPPTPVIDNPTTRLINAAQVGGPIAWGNLVLFPVRLPGAEPVARIHSLGEAMDRGWVAIEEDNPPAVGRATLVNRSDNLVLVLAGELIKGGQQNRSSQKDLLLLPNSRVAIDLYCVEQGRWTGAGRFESAKALAPQSVRAGNVAGGSQEQVWADVRSFNEAAKAASPSQSLLAGLDSAKVQGELADCRKQVVPRLPSNCVGLIAGRNGQIFAADIFVDQRLFESFRDMLINSYASQEVYYKLAPAPRPMPDPAPAPIPGPGDVRGGERIRPIPAPPPSRLDAMNFVNLALRASYDSMSTPGGGSLWRIGGLISGQALDYRGQAVHAALTREVIVPIMRPMPMPAPNPRLNPER